MNIRNEKCVMVIDENLPLGMVANIVAIMGMTLGKKLPEKIGNDVLDKSGVAHLGIIQFPIPILKANQTSIKKIYEKISELKDENMIIVDFSILAQGCKTYDEYIDKMKETNTHDLDYIGIALCGQQKMINKYTGSLPLLR